MESSALTAYEYQWLSIGDGVASSLTPTEAETLVELGRARPGFATLGHRAVRLTQYVGLVNLGGRVLEVLPKLGATDDAGACRGTLLRMLRLAHDTPLFSRDDVGHDLRRQTLLEIFVAAYLQALAMLVRAGLTRRYRSVEDDIGTIRGRFLLARQVTVHALRPDRLACRFDELVVDNPWNQVLKAALVVVRPWARSLDSGRRWLELAAAFEEVSTPADPMGLIGGLVADRQVQHYATALHWAGWILRLLSPNLRAGKSRAPELLFDMNQLFEAAVASRLRERAHSQGFRMVAQDVGRHLARSDSQESRPYFGVRPDIVLREDARIIAVADTKWSFIDRDLTGRLVPPEGHVYQLNAYASVYPCEELVLIYPWHAGQRDAQPTAFRLPSLADRKPILHVVCIDVGSDALTPYAPANSRVGSLLS